MAASIALAIMTLPALAIGAPVAAAPYSYPVNIRAGPLSTALQELARQTGAELLFDRSLVRSFRAPALDGRYSVESALARLLAGTDLTMRRAASGAWVIERRAPAPASQPEEETAELLVIGRRTQNADIRRRENDVQPYQVSSGQQIVRAHRDDLDQYFRSRVTGNTDSVPNNYLTGGETNSRIDLRGLGVNDTLILIDGRRMPSIPDLGGLEFDQPDINAIPLRAIERVETLTGTAGGIYGFGALGGVVNVVLKRDYRGLELHGTAGITSRGDGARVALEASLGFTPDHGRTDVSLFVSRSATDPLLESQRDYRLRARRIGYRLVPDQLIAWDPTGNSVGVFELFGDNLTLKPEYGGATLNSFYTYLPAGFAGAPADLAASLTRHAGQIDMTLSQPQATSGLTSSPTTISAIANVRHRFGGGIEAYLDALILRNHGHYLGHESDATLLLFPSDPQNPFDNYVTLAFPALPEDLYRSVRVNSQRYTGGIIVPLFGDWKGNAEATFGTVHRNEDAGGLHYYQGPFYLDGTESPDFNPFGNWAAFQQSLAAYQLDATRTENTYNRYREQSLRLAGPLFRTAAGPATLTMLAQNRDEKVPSYTSTVLSTYWGPDASISETRERSSGTHSLYAELRAPLVAQDARLPILKGLEVQLAVRNDRQRFDFYQQSSTTGMDEPVHAKFEGTVFTAGAKFFPLPWLMLRGSYATGQQPPPLSMLIPFEYMSSSYLLNDPHRVRDFFTDDGDYLLRMSGSPTLTTSRASTLSLGMVLNPLGESGPRISLDYSRIRRTHDPSALDENTILAHEDEFPGRVKREPLTDADRALGYTAGRIYEIDATATNGGKLNVETLDGRFNWPIAFAGGTLRLNASATLQIHNQVTPLLEPREERAGYRGGPLQWRANGGAEWSSGRTSIGANLQFYSKYRIAAQAYESVASVVEDPQGSPWVAAQAYLDLYASRRFPVHWGGRDREISIDLGVINLLDHAPPYQTDSAFITPQYSFFGDPRQRRFELTLSSAF